MAISSVFLVTAVVLYAAADPTYGIFSQYISDLGTGPNNSYIFFYLFTAAYPLLNLPFYLYLVRQLQLRGANAALSRCAFAFTVLCSLSHFLILFFPFDKANPPVYAVHLVLAVCIFFAISIATLLFALIELPQKSLPRSLPLTSLAASLSSMLAALFIGLWAVTDIFSHNIIAQVTEWTSFGLVAVFILFHAVYFLRNRMSAA